MLSRLQLSTAVLCTFKEGWMMNTSKASTGHDGSMDGVDLAQHPTAQKLASRSLEFLREVKDLCVTYFLLQSNRVY